MKETKKQILFEIQIILLVFISCSVFTLTIINFKEQNITSGILLLIYCIFSISIIVIHIKNFKNERPKTKG